MPKLMQEIKDDAEFIRTHTLQPQWYKVAKVFILIGFLAGYYLLFGFAKMAVFLAVFLLLSFGVHMLYRIRTKKFTRSWLDFVVVEEDGKAKPTRIGKCYYSFIILNAVIAVLVSQLCVS